MAYFRCQQYDYSNSKKIHSIIPKSLVASTPVKKSQIDPKAYQHSKDRMFRNIFYDFLKMVIDDCIENNDKFVSPNMQSFSVYIREKATAEKHRLLKTSAEVYRNVDIIKSDGKFYEFVLVSRWLRGSKYRKIRIGHSKYKEIVKKVNEGKRYFER